MVKRGKSCDSLILIISYTFVALWYWLAVQELTNIAISLKGEGDQNSWFATTWQGGHVGGQNERIFPRRIYMKIEFSS